MLPSGWFLAAGGRSQTQSSGSGEKRAVTVVVSLERRALALETLSPGREAERGEVRRGAGRSKYPPSELRDKPLSAARCFRGGGGAGAKREVQPDGGEDDESAGDCRAAGRFAESEPNPKGRQRRVERADQRRLHGRQIARAEREQTDPEGGVGEAEKREQDEFAAGNGERMAERPADQRADDGREGRRGKGRNVRKAARYDHDRRHAEGHGEGDGVAEPAALRAEAGHDRDAGESRGAGGERGAAGPLAQDEPAKAGGDERHGRIDDRRMGDGGQGQRDDEQDHREG